MGILDHLSNLRHARAVERFTQIGSLANWGRSGAAAAPAAAARAAGHADGGAGSGGGGGGGGGGGVLATIAAGVQAAIGVEQQITKALGDMMAALGIPGFPGFPALRVWDMDIGLPHAHNHPPNLTPPNPVPIPLPSTGPILPIPILSGASTVLINGTAAARCGDMGLGIWCGGYFPMFEIFLGSSSVWIESARAARLAIDITKHCTFSSPKPSDPPMGPMIGTTIGPGSGNVLIGGAPFPSLFSLAIAQAFKAIFKVGGAVFRRVTARARIMALIRKGRIVVNGGGKWGDDIMKDLERIATTRAGRELLDRIDKGGKTVTIHPYNNHFPTANGPVFAPHNAWAAPVGHSPGDALMDIPTGLKMPGSDSAVAHAPQNWANHAPPGSPHPHPGTSSDAILFHEMNHAANNSGGINRAQGTSSAHSWDNRWSNFEEYSTVAAENGYRSETGLPLRNAYNHLP
ncbi:MAG: M91 family zinc metallopeptidase [Nannocystaceae bacterium]|jgi:hypothetical protein